MKRYPRTNPGPFAIGPSGNHTGGPHFTSRRNYQILSQKDSLQAVGLLLWLGAKRHWCRCRKYYLCPAPSHQPTNYPPKLGCHMLALQGTLQPHLRFYPCYLYYYAVRNICQLRLHFFLNKNNTINPLHNTKKSLLNI